MHAGGVGCFFIGMPWFEPTGHIKHGMATSQAILWVGDCRWPQCCSTWLPDLPLDIRFVHCHRTLNASSRKDETLQDAIALGWLW